MNRITFEDQEEFSIVIDPGEELSDLRAEHQRLDTKIYAISEGSPCNQLEIQRLKKKKLWLKDKILFLKAYIQPNIIA